jgi:UDP-N-acetylmuramoyl-tripeptide--D-alanyl-D-alanine ligase
VKSFKVLFLFYLKWAAKIQLLKIRPKIVGIGGSSGKTSTTELVEIILASKYRVRGTHGKNSETGIPLSILGIKIKDYSKLSWLKVALSVPVKLLFDWEKYDYLVAEMGVDGATAPNNMEYLLGIIRPQTALLTNITYEHSLNFEEGIPEENFEENVLTAIANEEIKLLTTLRENDTAIVNGDDRNISKYLEMISARKIFVSEKTDAEFKVRNVSISEKSFILEFEALGRKFNLKINQPLPSYFAYSFLLAIALGNREGIEIDTAINALIKNFSLPPGRASVFRGVKSTLIIDSSYNSSLDAAVGMLEFLNVLGKGKRRVAITGDMRELGKMSKSLHEKLAEKIMENSDFAILIGPLTTQFVVPMLDSKGFKFATFKNFTEAKEKLLNLINENDVVLVKSSQNTLLLERAVEMLLKDKTDVKNLARRGQYWDEIRSKTA